MKSIITMVESLGPLRLLNVLGFEQRTNDIVYCHPQKSSENADIVVFFGGDVQVKYSLFNTNYVLQYIFNSIC